VLTIADGEGTTRVPKLVGIGYPKAETKLEEAGFLLGGVEEVASETEPVGVIVEQDPVAGTVLKPGGYVYLTPASVALTKAVPAGGRGSEANGCHRAYHKTVAPIRETKTTRSGCSSRPADQSNARARTRPDVRCWGD
jgi:PASTA domain